MEGKWGIIEDYLTEGIVEKYGGIADVLSYNDASDYFGNYVPGWHDLD